MKEEEQGRPPGSPLTLAVVTGLRQRLTVGQHGDFGHSHAHHGALFTGLVLSGWKQHIGVR